MFIFILLFELFPTSGTLSPFSTLVEKKDVALKQLKERNDALMTIVRRHQEMNEKMTKSMVGCEKHFEELEASMKLQKEQENEKLEKLKSELSSLRQTFELKNANLNEEIDFLEQDTCFFQEHLYDKILENQKLWEKNRLLLKENSELKREREFDKRWIEWMESTSERVNEKLTWMKIWIGDGTFDDYDF